MRSTVIISRLFLLLLMGSPVLAWSQIGIGTTNPHPSSMLHISPGPGNNKGMIIPKVTSANLVVMDSTQNIAHGLVFFDTDLQKFYYFHQSPRKWFELDHDWIRKDIPGSGAVVGTHIYSGVTGNVGIGTAANVNPAAKLTVVGNMSIGNASFTQDSVPPSNSLIVQTWVGVNTATRTSGYEMDVVGQVHVSSTMRVDGTVNADRFYGEGVVPTYGIVMYSGSLANFDGNGVGQGQYRGWQICNGKNNSPDLRGRFIVGMTNSDNLNHGYSNTEKNNTDYSNVGDFGGEREHALTLSEMPSHNHPGSSTSTDGNHRHPVDEPDGCWDFVGAGSSGCYFANPTTSKNTGFAGNHSHTLNITAQGSNAPHENRPPYYVLAFIMKQP